MDHERLEGQVAIVTGATQGVGEGIATRLLQEGADVIIRLAQLRSAVSGPSNGCASTDPVR